MPVNVAGSRITFRVSASLGTPKTAPAPSRTEKATRLRLQLVSSACTTAEWANSVPASRTRSANAAPSGAAAHRPVTCPAQVLEEVQQGANLVEGQAHDIDEKGNLQDEFDAEFTAAQEPGNFAIPVVGAAMDVVSDQHRAAIFQSPHGRTCERRQSLGSTPSGKTSSLTRLGDFVRRC